MKIATYIVQGMTCDHCVRAVKNEVGNLPGVESVDVDLSTGSVTVSSSTGIDEAQLRSAIEEAGYELVA